MRISEQSPNGVKGLSTLLVASEQVTPCCSSRCAGATPRGTLWSCVAAHQEQVGRRQHGDGDAGVGEPARDPSGAAGGERRELGDMADGDAAAAAVRVASAGTPRRDASRRDRDRNRDGSRCRGRSARAMAKMRAICPCGSRVGVGAAADQVGALARRPRPATPRCRDR